MAEQVPLVSVIVLTYNQEQTIVRAVESILAQKVDFEMEVVVSDDCSSDRTRNLLESLAEADGRVKLLPVHDRLGPVGNYFYAFSHCRGKYIADCAGDDYWTCSNLRFLSEKVRALEEAPGAVMAKSDWVEFLSGCPDDVRNPEGDPGSKIRGAIVDGKRILPFFLKGDRAFMIHLSTVVYRRDVIAGALERNRRIIAREEFGSEDFPIIAALLNAGDVIHIGSAPSLAYCVGGNSVSNPSDLVKKSDYFVRAARMIAEIADYYGCRDSVGRVLRDKLGYAWRLARKSHNPDVMAAVEAARRELGLSRISLLVSGFV